VPCRNKAQAIYDLAHSGSGFLEALRCGVQRTTDLIARVTEYRGGEVRTEYMITADLAREFMERDFEVMVECLNRRLVNAMIKLKGSTPVKTLRSKRTDVAIVRDGLVPLPMIEVKIGVRRFTRLKGDLDKIATTIEMMRANYAAKVIGAAVFQVHIPGSRNMYHASEFKAAARKVEKTLESDIVAYARLHSNFRFTMHPLQSPDGGVVGRDLEIVGNELAWGAHGHATRYHAILIQSTRPISAPPTTVQELKRQSEE
jgi:hypothetical protein